MADVTDEILMAYADGEFDSAMRAEVEAALKRDPQARERLKIFVATGAPLAKFFDPALEAPVAAHLVTLIKNEKKTKTVRGRYLFFSNPFEAVGWTLPGSPRWPLVVAAGLVKVVAITALVLYIRQVGNDMTELVALEQGQIFAQGPLAEALETVPSGTKVSLGGEKSAVTVETVLTFKNRRQVFCRQYEVTTPKNGYAGIACRGGDGRWQVEIHIAAAVHSPANDRIVPAGKGASDVEAAVNNVIEGDALGREDEKTLIQNNWQPSS